MCDTVAAQLVGHEPHGFLSLTLQQSAKESPRCTPVPTGLYEDVDQVTVLIHRAPEILALTVDRHEDFVQEPRISESTPYGAKSGRPRLGRCWSSPPSSLRLCRLRCSSSSSRSLAG